MDEWHKKAEALALQDEWVMEGNMASTFDVRMPRATQIIHFDLPGFLCIYRCIKRRIQTGRRVRVDMAQGCLEKFDLSFYKYVWSYPKHHSPIVYRRANELCLGEFTVVKNPSDVAKLEKELGL